MLQLYALDIKLYVVISNVIKFSNTVGSPELFDKSEDVPVSERHQCTEDSGQMLADSTDSSLDSSRQDMGDHVRSVSTIQH